MTRVVFVGELYNADLSIGGGPIYPPSQPPGIWGPPGPWPTPPIAPGGPPPGIWPSPGHPAHPIAPGGRPPGIWGGAPPWVDNTLPQPQPIPGWPPVAMPPIYIPPEGATPPPGAPPWVSHPIPPTVWPEPPVEGVPPTMIEWKSGWSQATGWVVVGIPQAPVPTPSA
jgi:hypothetical protein